MDFSDNRQEAEFRSRARVWLAANAPGAEALETAAKTSAAQLELAKAWQAQKADAGYTCITWPKAAGGAGGSAIEQAIFDEEEARHGLADAKAPFAIGLGMCVPTVMAFADDATQQRMVMPAVRGEQIWCQLFSEPAAGSDVAGIRTRALPAGDGSGDWIINGQKVWTSGAHYADYGIVITRSNADVPKHKGLTMFWVDMTAPGVRVVPIHQASGGSGFNEVYFSDVRIPDGQRLGAVDGGWKVALFTLMNERLSIGGGAGPGWRELLALARTLPGIDGRSAAEDGAFRAKLADWCVMADGLRFTRLRAMTALSRGATPGPENSIGKLIAATLAQEIGNEALDRLDEYGMVDERDSHSEIAAFQHNFFHGAALRIAGGTDEILRNIIAERVLEMPADVRVDRDVAFKDLPRGA